MAAGSIVRLACLALLWGSNFLWIKIAVRGVSPVQLTLVRLALGAAVLLVVLQARRLRLPHDWMTWLHLSIAALVANALPYWLFAVGEQHVTSSLAGALNATTPLWALGVALALRAEHRVVWTRLVGLLLGFLGTLVILAPWQEGTAGSMVGALACLAAAASYGLSYAYQGRYLTGRGRSPVVLSAGQLAAATALLAVVTPIVGRQSVTLTPAVASAIVILGVLGTGAAYVLNYRLIADEGATAASTVTYLLPVVSVALGVAVLGEPATWHLLVGTVIVLAGIALVQQRRSRALSRL